MVRPFQNALETGKASQKARLPRKNSNRLRSLDDVHNATATLGAELNLASNKCEQSVVLALASVCAWVEVSATLTDDNLACVYFLTCITLNA
jgi:ABC-type hemin transport system ATPase subunit